MATLMPDPICYWTDDYHRDDRPQRNSFKVLAELEEHPVTENGTRGKIASRWCGQDGNPQSHSGRLVFAHHYWWNVAATIGLVTTEMGTFLHRRYAVH